VTLYCAKGALDRARSAKDPEGLMISASRASRFVSIVVVLTLILGVVPALALELPAGTVTQHVTVAGTDPSLDLIGTTTATALPMMLAQCAEPVLAPLAVQAAGTTFTLDPADYIHLDADAMFATALAAAEPTTIAPVWVPATDRITEYVGVLAARIDAPAVNARRYIRSHRLKIAKELAGRSLDRSGAVSAITAAIGAEIAAAGAQQPTVVVRVTAVPAAVTLANIGKTILVVLHERHVILYNGAKVERKYDCAIGMRAYPTPKGIFKIIKKNPHPSWGNPYSPWSRSMPAYIRPGFYNPLGLRALYLNASGIRIHGTAQTWSMGHAASHGCIRLTNHNILDLYPRVKVGTQVQILS
jgi:lipoprotein-anchoring transpeptidase ErfK/SrfK